MLTITGLKRFYFLHDFDDMRCKYGRVLSIIHWQLDLKPEEGEVFIALSKDCRLGLTTIFNMTPIEKSMLINELFSLRKTDEELMESERKLMESDRKNLDDLLDSFQVVNVELRALRVQLSDLLKQLAAKDAENAALREKLKLSRRNL